MYSTRQKLMGRTRNWKIEKEIASCVILSVEKNSSEGLPWWLSGACQGRRHGFAPCSAEIPHAAEQLHVCPNDWACAPGPGGCSYWAMDKYRNRSSAHSLESAPHSKTGHHREQPAHVPSEHPTLQQPEKHPRSDKDPPSQKLFN